MNKVFDKMKYELFIDQVKVAIDLNNSDYEAQILNGFLMIQSRGMRVDKIICNSKTNQFLFTNLNQEINLNLGFENIFGAKPVIDEKLKDMRIILQGESRSEYSMNLIKDNNYQLGNVEWKDFSNILI